MTSNSKRIEFLIHQMEKHLENNIPVLELEKTHVRNPWSISDSSSQYSFLHLRQNISDAMMDTNSRWRIQKDKHQKESYKNKNDCCNNTDSYRSSREIYSYPHPIAPSENNSNQEMS